METQRLHEQLIKLGDMMGDGLHHEPDGKWIEREYKKVAQALGYVPKRKNNANAINERITTRCSEVPCALCGGLLKQTRSGSKRAVCTQCCSKWKLLK